jgi:anaerobic ribonucleoside-triphosphate reductase activating protein
MVDECSSVDGVTISGGEPFDQADALGMLLEILHQLPSLKGADILVYSGYSLAVLRRSHQGILDMIDALISDPYVESRPTALPWRGSANQRLTLLSEKGKARFAVPTPPHHLQVSADGGRVWIAGIPRRGDLEQFEALLSRSGVELEDVSWRA